MTISEANAVNETANEVLALAKAGVAITPELEHGIAVGLINANKRLAAGWDIRSFVKALAAATAKAVRA
jgi:hypothetical protein